MSDDSHMIEGPNLITGATEISFSIAKRSLVHLRIYSATGRLVRTLIDGDSLQGNQKASWNGRDDHGNTVVSGVYYYELATDSENERYVKRMILVR